MHFNKYSTLSFNNFQLIKCNSKASNTFFDKGGGSQGTGSSSSSSFLLAWLSLSIGKSQTAQMQRNGKWKTVAGPSKQLPLPRPGLFIFLPQQVVKHKTRRRTKKQKHRRLLYTILNFFSTPKEIQISLQVLYIKNKRKKKNSSVQCF